LFRINLEETLLLLLYRWKLSSTKLTLACVLLNNLINSRVIFQVQQYANNVSLFLFLFLRLDTKKNLDLLNFLLVSNLLTKNCVTIRYQKNRSQRKVYILMGYIFHIFVIRHKRQLILIIDSIEAKQKFFSMLYANKCMLQTILFNIL